MTLTMKNTSMKLEYIAEDSRGSAMSTGSLDLPSDSVENVTISGSKNGEIIYLSLIHISEPTRPY